MMCQGEGERRRERSGMLSKRRDVQVSPTGLFEDRSVLISERSK